jgi:hypothetical protein
MRIPPPLRIVDLVDFRNKEWKQANHQWSIGIASQQLGPADVISVAVDHGVQQIVQTANREFAKEIKVSIVMLQNPGCFLECPLSTVLDPDNVSPGREEELTIFKITFSSSREKVSIIEKVREHISPFARSLLADDICITVDELFTNAIYNAPVEGEGREAIDRNPEVEARLEKPGTLFLGRVENRVVVGCADLYGSLQPERLLKRIHDCYQYGTEKMMRWGPGGAGIGSYMIYESCSGMYIGIEPGKRTIVCCSFPLKTSAIERQMLPKNLHLISFGKT